MSTSDYNMANRERKTTKVDFPLEALRLDFTELNQDAFIVSCGIPRATYRRWMSGQTPVKPTLEQIISICRLCKVSLKQLFEHLGMDVSGIPDDPPASEETAQPPDE